MERQREPDPSRGSSGTVSQNPAVTTTASQTVAVLDLWARTIKSTAAISGGLGKDF